FHLNLWDRQKNSIGNDVHRSEIKSKNSAPMTDAHKIISPESSVSVKSDQIAGAIKQFKMI
ncbi:MAG: hypothetical protein MHMPM18_000822, partial [Marteilia pararefringens]